MIRVLDEVIELGERGVALLCMEGEPKGGMRIADARGNVHLVADVAEQGDGLYTLYLPNGDPDYFGRLMRDVRVDATVFEEAL